MPKRKRQRKSKAKARKKGETAPPKEEKAQEQRRGYYGWRGDELYYFPVYDVPRLVATLKDFPELLRGRELRRKEWARRRRMTLTRWENRRKLLAK